MLCAAAAPHKRSAILHPLSDSFDLVLLAVSVVVKETAMLNATMALLYLWSDHHFGFGDTVSSQ